MTTNSYEEIRLVRLYLRQQDSTTQGGQLPVSGRQSGRAADTSVPTPPAQGTTESEDQSDSPAARRGRRKRSGRVGSTYEKTRQLWEQGLSVEQIAKKRNLAKTTIVGHLDRLMDGGLEIDLRPLLPPPEKVEAIRKAFEETGGTLMSPVKELLGDAYGYDEIKLVLIFLRRQGERSE